jgi:C4-dicarboxylate-specific signal transduction histidine kinase
MRRLPPVLLFFLSFATYAADTSAPAQPPVRVLLLFPSDLLLPWALEQAENTKAAIRAAMPEGVEFFAEGLDAVRLPGPDYEKEFVALILKRYEAVPPDLLVLHGPMSGFVRRQRATLWPQTPVMAVSTLAQPDSDFPADFPQTSVTFDVAGTINLALRLQPAAKTLVVVGSTSPFSRAELANARRQADAFRDRLAIEYLIDKEPAEMERRLAELTRDAILLQLPVLRGTDGKFDPPRELASRLAARSNAPSYVYYPNNLGRGHLGGAMVNWAGQQEKIGKIARELLLDEPRKESLRMHPPTPSVCAVDWREMKRWNLPLSRLPENCLIEFRELSLWKRYRKETIAIGIVLLIQTALIVALILQRHRRQAAELELSQQRLQLAHAARLATVGELSASIAHEINQPLAAILSNAEAGETLIDSGAAKFGELREILANIRDDDVRAGEVIKRMRRLLRSEPNEKLPLDINEAVNSILRLSDGVARLHGVTVHTDLAPALPLIKGDLIQLQQVMLNLILNAIDAVQACPPERRRVTIRSREHPASNVEVSVTDNGSGIPVEKMKRIFEPFFSTKAGGMGLGLSITRSIVQAHRGKIWVESCAAGATFHFSIPA